MRVRSIHPFPARMAPELAINTLEDLSRPSVVLDPMAGSGVVLRHATDMGHRAIGYDVDPLAVLISRVWTTPISDHSIESICRHVLKDAQACNPKKIVLPWIDCDSETTEFINFWFGKRQQGDLRRISFAIYARSIQTDCPKERASLDVMRVALSRIIITKEQSASLARDTSHSRPHRVTTSSDYNVFDGFHRSFQIVRNRLMTAPPRKASEIKLGDARDIKVPSGSIDLVITSPPYLNAIDYMRGHRLSLVWLGYRLSDLRKIRSDSIGTERGLDSQTESVNAIIESMGHIERLPSRYRRIIERYAHDLLLVTKEVSRVLKESSQATFVIGNSCLKGIFIKNSDALVTAAATNGLRLISSFERELPRKNRYLPMTQTGALGKRMRTETVLNMKPAFLGKSI